MFGLERRLLELPRFAKRALVIFVDALLCAGSVVLAFYLRLGELPDDVWPLTFTFMLALCTSLSAFVALGLYRAIFRYSGWLAMSTVLRAVLLCSVPMIAIVSMVGLPGVPRTIGIIQPILLLLLIGASRAIATRWLGEPYRRRLGSHAKAIVAIYGAGNAGRQLASALASGSGMRVVAYLDDNPALWGQTLNAIPIFDPSELPQLIERRGVTDVLLALPSCTRAQRSEIITRLRPHTIHVRTLPDLVDLARGRVSLSDVKELDIDDLLGRKAVGPDRDLLGETITGRVVMVTGAGGSIGGELCRQILALEPARLILVEVSEFALYMIHQELVQFVRRKGSAAEIVPLLASVRDERRMDEIFRRLHPDTIYHAAAYKHVPLVEHNIGEGIRNNVFGTQVVAQLARRYGAARFILVSTDKAVRPTNVMGASKRLAELVLQALAHEGGATCFAMVRFGNVLGSSGSVVPLFRRQIEAGGPVTVTHPDVTRYFMTIPEAAQLVIQAATLAGGGEVFVLDMGEPVRIIDLAKNMIELSGLSVRGDDHPDGDIAIEVVGLRPGEKLFEELLIGNSPESTQHPRILKANEIFVPAAHLRAGIERLLQALDVGDMEIVREILAEQVSDYTPNSEMVDPMHWPNGEGRHLAPYESSAQLGMSGDRSTFPVFVNR